ncbi:type I-E CRISPR-associated protein Cas6/Cse3/CasE [Arachnia propionica]|uniref:Type I-E CRISPR-associated protein Cas6/Cse3/CasE n=2 Tax=Arachnia propionica TaxID=1750 RepID=A0A3P1T2E1_9ACTN|nr:type I-E CRISPR-associated protein Cas6/Cse3/CasE [Arachnia propionica]
MFLTRTFLNARRAGARKLILSPQAMHAAVLSGFPPGPEEQRPLWRLDSDDPLRPALYIVSERCPDLTHIEEQAGWPTQPTTQSAGYSGLLDSLGQDQQWGFRLTANPTHRVRSGEKFKIYAHVTVAQQTDWLLSRAGELGIDFGNPESPDFLVTEHQSKRFRRGGGTVTIGTATFNGVLTITDPDKLRLALTQGIGRAKAYGCGLMTLARI